ncbi:MAG: ribonuclease H-like domain-containing protein [Methanomassiliicoccales archaeon]|nr:ribonuclease H-like domain-containing protein [Methanomassiliicoccales archaeon]
MIKRTFLLLPGIGQVKERRLWERGVRSWEEFSQCKRLEGISPARKPVLDRELDMAMDSWERGRTEYFSRLLPSGQHWRMYERLREDTVYLDIETDGLGPSAVVTMLSVHRAGETVTLTRGMDLTAENIGRAMNRAKLLVTFNGSTFDLPMIEREFPFSVPRVPHYDLRHACPKVGLRGGLKHVEFMLGYRRPQEVEYVTGEEAVYLWHLWERKGNENALRLLRRYNQEDARNLEPLAGTVYARLADRLLQGCGE